MAERCGVHLRQQLLIEQTEKKLGHLDPLDGIYMAGRQLDMTGSVPVDLYGSSHAHYIMSDIFLLAKKSGMIPHPDAGSVYTVLG
jgi:hypothetical protein